jgi:hypothetical protein
MIAQAATQTAQSDVADRGKRFLIGRTLATTIPSAATEKGDRAQENRSAAFLTD